MSEILDSGERRSFSTGSVRDIQKGKGRCDLLPLDIVAGFYHPEVLQPISKFTRNGEIGFLCEAVAAIVPEFGDYSTMFLEVAKHFEDGAEKYGEYNWQKGIPAHCYIDSAVRHYFKYKRGDTDEPHARAFVWNILCCIWTCWHMPELNDYYKGGDS